MFGAFDLFHAGHVLMLQEAKTICGHLLVCIRTDPHIDRRTKNTPIQSIVEREFTSRAQTPDKCYFTRRPHNFSTFRKASPPLEVVCNPLFPRIH
ncbi:MAG: adenylyltransferase/cytidyltransferase family protein [Gammaproteobacteria bacterium]